MNKMNKMNKLSKIAIFNGFPFHYEMFGYICHFAKNNNYHVDIYTNKKNNMGFLDFYITVFKNISIFNSHIYDPKNNYKFIFVTTDDDLFFKKEWINEKVICINHYYEIRNHEFKRYINVAKFLDSRLDYAIPCYPLINPNEKQKNKIVTIIGGGEFYNNIIIKRVNCETLNVISRVIHTSFDDFPFTVNTYTSADTSMIIETLKNSSYVFLSPTTHVDFIVGKRTSGVIGLAFTTLCKIIISKQLNKILDFKNCLEYDLDSTEPIQLTDPDFEKIAEEREMYIHSFDRIVKNNGII
jgi:hypothetical protein